MDAVSKREIVLVVGIALLLCAALLVTLSWRGRRVMGDAPPLVAFLCGVALIGLALLPLAPAAPAPRQMAGAASLIPGYGTPALFQHSVSGWGVYTPEDAQQAANDGIGNVFLYGLPYTPDTAMGQTLSGLRLTQVDGALWQYLHAYECTRLLAKGLSLQDTAGYCTIDYGESLDELLSDVRQHLTSIADDPSIVGFWILDDWPWKLDAGGVRTVLQQITAMVHSIDPGRPTICGIGAELGSDKTDVWHTKVAQNFSPTGCDAVGLYVYSESVTDPATSPDTFDWSMKTLLPKIMASLGKEGWLPQSEPLIGIAQAWAGTRLDAPGYYEIAPTAADLAEQALSFCRAGVVGISFYAWHTSALANLQTPTDNAAINDGMREGIAQCQQYWG